MAQAVEDWYKQMPIITRTYLTAAIVTTVGCSLDVCHLLSLMLVFGLAIMGFMYRLLWFFCVGFSN